MDITESVAVSKELVREAGRVFITICDPLPLAPLCLDDAVDRPAYIGDLDPSLGDKATGMTIRWNGWEWTISSAAEIGQGPYQYHAQK